MDLLTVLTHELGHDLGLDHREDGVMQDSLATGERLSVSDEHLSADGAWQRFKLGHRRTSDHADSGMLSELLDLVQANIA